ncbi:MAG: hypothetical protein KAS32_16835 [Candidatus Peribacteraceae bacterium]|nr:hypothetical protein [Candidatus Peribacteraceae bacterium]
MEDKLCMRARLGREHFGVDIDIVSEDRRTGRISVIKNIEFQAADVGTAHSTPLAIDDVMAKRLMDDLWLAGIRPTNDLMGETNKDDMKAHLNDMRSIVFNGISITAKKEVDTTPK